MQREISRRQVLIGLVSSCTSLLICWRRARRAQQPHRGSRRLPAAPADADSRGLYTTYTYYNAEAEPLIGGPVTTVTYDVGPERHTRIESTEEGG